MSFRHQCETIQAWLPPLSLGGIARLIGIGFLGTIGTVVVGGLTIPSLPRPGWCIQQDGTKVMWCEGRAARSAGHMRAPWTNMDENGRIKLAPGDGALWPAVASDPASVTISSGWPWAAAWGSVSLSSNFISPWTVVSSDCALVLSENAHEAEVLLSLRVIPYSPLWSGIVGNVIVWGLLAWCIRAGWGAVHLRSRALGGRCRNCGHQLTQGSTGQCPECGWSSSPRMNSR